MYWDDDDDSVIHAIIIIVVYIIVRILSSGWFLYVDLEKKDN